jgi:hypothetical protein
MAAIGREFGHYVTVSNVCLMINKAVIALANIISPLRVGFCLTVSKTEYLFQAPLRQSASRFPPL